MHAGEFMTRDVVTVRPDATVREAARLMDDLNVGVLPVCDGRRLVGIVTDRDITVRATADGMRPDATPVHMVMTDDVCWCFEDDSIEEIEREMARHQIRRLPVVDARHRPQRLHRWQVVNCETEPTGWLSAQKTIFSPIIAACEV